MPLHPHSGVVFTPPELAARLVEALPETAGGAVLDPAMGEGALLLAALAARGGDPSFARRHIHGIDIDPARVERARERLRRAAGLPVGSALDRHLICANALEVSWPAKTSIVANPPWLSFSGRQAEQGPDRERFERSGSSAGWPSLQGAFCARIAEHVARERTSASVLLPASVTELEGYAALRERVTAVCKLPSPPVELGEDAFPGVVGSAVLITLTGRTAAGGGSTGAWTIATREEEAFLLEVSRAPRLSARTFADPGVHTGNSAKLLIRSEPMPGTEGVRRGRDLSAYELGPASAWLRTDLVPTEEQRFRISDRERYESFPILLRQTADRPVAALHTPAGYFRNSLLACRGVPDLDPAFIVAILNGHVAGAWHRLAHRDARQRAFPQVKVSHLRNQPFPITRRADDPGLHDDVVRRLHALEPRTSGFDARLEELDRIVLTSFALSDAAQAMALSTGALEPRNK